jgi:hypothetical protein
MTTALDLGVNRRSDTRHIFIFIYGVYYKEKEKNGNGFLCSHPTFAAPEYFPDNHRKKSVWVKERTLLHQPTVELHISFPST